MNTNNLAALIDAFGALKAREADLAAEIRTMKEALLDLPEGSHEGELFKLDVTYPARSTRDEHFKARVEALIAKHISEKYVKEHTETKTARTLTVRARNGRKA